SLPFIKPQLFETVFADRNLESILLSAASDERPEGYALLKSLVADGGVTTVLLRLALLCVFRLRYPSPDGLCAAVITRRTASPVSAIADPPEMIVRAIRQRRPPGTRLHRTLRIRGALSARGTARCRIARPRASAAGYRGHGNVPRPNERLQRP